MPLSSRSISGLVYTQTIYPFQISRSFTAMESCVNTEKDIDKVIAKFGSYKNHYESSLQQLEDQMNKLKSELQQLPPDEPIGKRQAVLMQYNKKIKTTGQKLSSNHKELHSIVSRVGKTIDKNFDADCSSVFPTPLCQDAEVSI